RQGQLATGGSCDLDKSQLKLCRQNFRWLGRKAVLKRGDVTRPFGIPCRDKSVDKVVTAPPWNRQFRVKGDLEDFYRKMFQETRPLVMQSYGNAATGTGSRSRLT
ncbi:unnamed protein product, partial [Effrenium voratum]